MFFEPLTQIPDLQPHVTAHILAGPHMNEAWCFFVTVSPLGVHVQSPNGRGAMYDRLEMASELSRTLYDIHTESLALRQDLPLMEFFRPGWEYTPTDEFTFNIVNGFLRAFCDYHTVRKRGYRHLQVDLEKNFVDLELSSYMPPGGKEGWLAQIAAVEQLADDESNLANHYKALCHVDSMYGATDSMQSVLRDMGMVKL